MENEIKLIYLHRKLVNLKYANKKIRYWWYNRKYERLLKKSMEN